MADSYYYRAYGRTICSDTHLPSLISIPPLNDPTLQISKNPCPYIATAAKRRWLRTKDLAPTGLPWLTVQRFVHDGGFYLQLGDHIDFVIDGSGHRIWSPAFQNDGQQAAHIYLYGLVIGLALCLQGSTCLHASAVGIGDEAILFVGDAGYGKSSLAAVFVQLGYPLITDDLVVLDPGHAAPLIPPGVPSLRIRPDIASFLLGPDHSLPWDNQAGKYMLRLENESSQFAGNPLRLGAVYLLGSDNREIDRLSSRDGLLALSRFPYLPDLLDKSMVRAQFEMLSSLALTIPVCQLPSFRDPTQLVDLGQKIVKHVGKHLMDAA